MQLSLMSVTKISLRCSHELLPHLVIISGSHQLAEEAAVAGALGSLLDFCLIVFFFFARGLKVVELSFVASGFLWQAVVYDSG